MSAPRRGDKWHALFHRRIGLYLRPSRDGEYRYRRPARLVQRIHDLAERADKRRDSGQTWDEFEIQAARELRVRLPAGFRRPSDAELRAMSYEQRGAWLERAQGIVSRD